MKRGVQDAHRESTLPTMPALSRSAAPAAPKRAINLTVRGDLLQAAREERVNLSAILERALEEELAALKRRRWRLEHARAIEAYNAHVRRHSPALQGTRTF
ncbi:MAG TPA: type II toxin-antitoxin system CcdA family antitoxin [Steroidobacteraceae bacterium]|nr:type II toxin-antitoxin system CcdA family antitoxin [Steroidobacteraceae bacterium]